jgi:hypothetical protein
MSRESLSLIKDFTLQAWPVITRYLKQSEIETVEAKFWQLRLLKAAKQWQADGRPAQ